MFRWKVHEETHTVAVLGPDQVPFDVGYSTPDVDRLVLEGPTFKLELRKLEEKEFRLARSRFSWIAQQR